MSYFKVKFLDLPNIWNSMMFIRCYFWKNLSQIINILHLICLFGLFPFFGKLIKIPANFSPLQSFLLISSTEKTTCWHFYVI